MQLMQTDAATIALYTLVGSLASTLVGGVVALIVNRRQVRDSAQTSADKTLEKAQAAEARAVEHRLAQREERIRELEADLDDCQRERALVAQQRDEAIDRLANYVRGRRAIEGSES